MKTPVIYVFKTVLYKKYCRQFYLCAAAALRCCWMTPDISSRFLFARMWAPKRFFKNRRHRLSRNIVIEPYLASIIPFKPH